MGASMIPRALVHGCHRHNRVVAFASFATTERGLLTPLRRQQVRLVRKKRRTRTCAVISPGAVISPAHAAWALQHTVAAVKRLPVWGTAPATACLLLLLIRALAWLTSRVAASFQGARRGGATIHNGGQPAASSGSSVPQPQQGMFQNSGDGQLAVQLSKPVNQYLGDDVGEAQWGVAVGVAEQEVQSSAQLEASSCVLLLEEDAPQRVAEGRRTAAAANIPGSGSGSTAYVAQGVVREADLDAYLLSSEPLPVLLAEGELPASLGDLWATMFREQGLAGQQGGNTFVDRLYNKLGYTGVKLGSWEHNRRRVVSFCKPLKPKPLSPLSADCHETWGVARKGRDGFVVNVVAVTPKVPFGETFFCRVQFEGRQEEGSACRLTIRGDVVFVRGSWLKGIIRKEALAGMQETYQSFLQELRLFLLAEGGGGTRAGGGGAGATLTLGGAGRSIVSSAGGGGDGGGGGELALAQAAAVQQQQQSTLKLLLAVVVLLLLAVGLMYGKVVALQGQVMDLASQVDTMMVPSK